MPKAKHRVALLIDCDNVSHAHLDWILEQAAKQGNTLIRRAYGDFDARVPRGCREEEGVAPEHASRQLLPNLPL